MTTQVATARRPFTIFFAVLICLPVVEGAAEDSLRSETVDRVESTGSTTGKSRPGGSASVDGPADTTAEKSEPEFAFDRMEARQTYREHLRLKDYDQAIDAANMALAMTEHELGTRDMELVPILNDLGDAYIKARRPAEALAYLRRSINIIRDDQGIFAQELVRPLYFMGRAHQELGDHASAVASFQRAQHITHRLQGVMNADQIPIIQALAASHAAQEHWDEAESLHLLNYKLQSRKLGEESLEKLAALYELGDWYREIDDYHQARLIYRRGLDLLEQSGEPDSPQAIPALRGIAKAFLSERGEHWKRGLRSHRRIIDIVESRPENFSLEERITAHLELGDWLVMVDYDEEASAQYRQAYELAQQDTDGARDWSEVFGRPHVLYPGHSLHTNLTGIVALTKDVYFDFEFDIQPSGRPTDIVVTDSNLHGTVLVAAEHAFGEARFRPRIVDGKAVGSEHLKLRREFPKDANQDFRGLTFRVY